MKALSKEELLEWFDKQILDPVHKCVWGTERDRQAYRQIRQLIEKQPKAEVRAKKESNESK